MSKGIIIKPTREIYIKPYSTKELADLYGVSYKTFLSWIAPFKSKLGKKTGRILTIPQVKVIFENLDYPTMSIVKLTEDDG